MPICKDCLKEKTYTSRNNLCFRCARVRMIGNITSLRKGEGKTYEKWDRNIKKAGKLGRRLTAEEKAEDS